MITAKEARKEAEQHLPKLIERELKAIDEKVKDAASNGYFATHYRIETIAILDTITKELRDMGFNVSSPKQSLEGDILQLTIGW